MKKALRKFQFIAIVIISILYCAHIQALNDDPHAKAVKTARESLLKQFESHEYDQALLYAKLIVDINEGSHSAHSREMAVALTDLGIIHLKLDQYDHAKDCLGRSVRIIEDIEGEFSPLLVKALQHLGYLNFRNEEYESSMDYFRRVQHILHRNDGVYSMKQLGTLDWISRISMRTHQYVNADLQQKFYYKINERHYGPADVRMIPVIQKIGNWYQMTGRYKKALQAYESELDLTEKNGVDSQLKLVQPLKQMSYMLYLQDACCPEEPLERVLSITRSDPAADLADQLAALVMLADMHLVKKNNTRARALYKEAWDTMAIDNQLSEKDELLFKEPILLGLSRTDEVVNAFRRALDNSLTDYAPPHNVKFFRPMREPLSARISGIADTAQGAGIWLGQLVGNPIPVCYPQVLKFVRSNKKEELYKYYIDLKFAVNDEGRVSDVEVTASNTPLKLVRYVKYILYSTRYRPRIESGVPTGTENLLLQQTFHPTNGSDDISMTFGAGARRAAVNHGCQLLNAAGG